MRVLPVCCRGFFTAFAIGAVVASGSAVAQSAESDPATPRVPASSDSATRSSPPVARDFSADVEMRKRYGIAALEIIGFDVLVNVVNRYGSGSDDYDSNLSTIKRNLRSSWGVDNDPFRINQLGHPYQGSMYHGFARSSGLNFWESSAYTFAGSAAWEIAGEKTRPSGNDQVASGIGGAFLGEALFRMASLVLENKSTPSFWREASAAAISPATGFNRLVFGQRDDTIFSSHGAEYYSRLNVGYSRSTENDAGLSVTSIKPNEAQAEFVIDYGLPGKPGYEYTRPFDHFSFQATATSANTFENVLTRGSLFARGYEIGRDYRGVLGLYGSYDYIAPQTFRVSTTALSLGTTGQYRASDAITLQGSALLGAGYAAVGTVRSTDERDYHYGVAPQGLLAFRVIYANKISLDLTGREYFVSRVAAAERGGHENISRLDASLTYRIKGPHAVSVKYIGNRRDASYPDIGGRKQTRGTIGIYYTLLGHDQFGAVQW
ncbi:MAG: DUF3943 domain-containing protein [Burkholderiaceae bacterium]